MKAFVLVVTEPSATRRVATAIKEIDQVIDVHEVMGPYDIVVELQAEHLREISTVILDQLRSMDGIQSTTSLVAFPI